MTDIYGTALFFIDGTTHVITATSLEGSAEDAARVIDRFVEMWEQDSPDLMLPRMEPVTFDPANPAVTAKVWPSVEAFLAQYDGL